MDLNTKANGNEIFSTDGGERVGMTVAATRETIYKE
jgi:hypothetical protein